LLIFAFQLQGSALCLNSDALPHPAVRRWGRNALRERGRV